MNKLTFWDGFTMKMHITSTLCLCDYCLKKLIFVVFLLPIIQGICIPAMLRILLKWLMKCVPFQVDASNVWCSTLQPIHSLQGWLWKKVIRRCHKTETVGTVSDSYLSLHIDSNYLKLKPRCTADFEWVYIFCVKPLTFESYLLP